MNGVLPFHQRIAELWVLNQKRELTEEEMNEMYVCMKANVHHCWEAAYRMNMSFMDSLVKNVNWTDEITLEENE